MNLTDKFRTSVTILRHSLEVMRRHPLLLVFPLISLLASVVVYLFFLAPLLLDMSLSDVWSTLWSPDQRWDALAPWAAARDASAGTGIAPAAAMPDLPFTGLAVYYLVAMFLMTFANVALYSQVIDAMNGGKVSVARGLATAMYRLPAIAGWTLLASTVGFVLKALQDRSWGIGSRILSGLAGFSWSAASVFVIPVMIRESQSRGPFEYLRISTGLLRRTWGEGLVGVVGLWTITMLVLFPLMVLHSALTIAGGMQLAAFNIALVMVAMMVLHLASQIFECGLYVYATEGVAPGTFDEATFDRAWTIGRGAQPASAPAAAAKPVALWPWLAAPVAVVAASVLVMYLLQPAYRVPIVGTEVNRISINLDQLDYKLRLGNLQAAGLFAGQRCKCDFSREGRIAALNNITDGKIDTYMWRQGHALYFHFFAIDHATGQLRVDKTLAALRAQFPGHEQAIHVIDEIPYAPPNGWNGPQVRMDEPRLVAIAPAP